MLLDSKTDAPPDTPAEQASKPQREVSRREVREAAMVIVLSALTLEMPAAECLHGIATMFGGERRQRAVHDALAQDIARTFDLQRDDIETALAEHARMPLAQMTMMERAILSAAMAEMRARPDTPRKVVINESVELAKRFGAEGGTQLVNGVLDAVARQPS